MDQWVGANGARSHRRRIRSRAGRPAAGTLTGNKTMEAEGRAEHRSVQRKTYRVMAQPEGGWIVESGEFGQVAGVHRTKEEALRSAREVAKTHQPSQVLVYKKDQTVQAEHTYE